MTGSKSTPRKSEVLKLKMLSVIHYFYEMTGLKILGVKGWGTISVSRLEEPMFRVTRSREKGWVSARACKTVGRVQVWW